MAPVDTLKSLESYGTIFIDAGHPWVTGDQFSWSMSLQDSTFPIPAQSGTPTKETLCPPEGFNVSWLGPWRNRGE